MKQYVIALDQGTTSSRAILFDREQNIIAMGQKEFPQHYPKAGYVEHDPMEIYSSQYGVMVEVLAKSNVQPEEIAAIGITNQRETTIVWDKETGRPIYNAIVWQCRRTAPLCEELKRRAWRTTSASARASSSMPIFPAPRSSGSWTMCRMPARWPRKAVCSSARWIPGSSGN